MSSTVTICPDPEVTEADEMEGAWQVLSANASRDGAVRQPVHLLTQNGWEHSKVRPLLLRMQRRGWVKLGNGNTFYSLLLTRKATDTPAAAVTILRVPPPDPGLPVNQAAASAPAKEKTEEKPLTPSEIDAVLYGALLTELIERSFRSALDGYVSLETYRRRAEHLSHDPEETLVVLVERGYCSLWVIRPDGLQEATLPPKGEPRITLVCVEYIPVVRPSKNQESGKEEDGHRSPNRSYSYDPPRRLNRPARYRQEKELPRWHPFVGWPPKEEPETSIVGKEVAVTSLPQEDEAPMPSPTAKPTPPPSAKSVPEPAHKAEAPARREHEDQALDRACFFALQTAMKEDRTVYAYMAILAPVFHKHGVQEDSRRRAAVQRLVDAGFLERRGKSSLKVLDRAPPPKPAPIAEPVPDELELAYKALVLKKSRVRGNDGKFFTTMPKQVLGMHPPYLGSEPADRALEEMERRNWIRKVHTGASSFYAVLLRDP